MNYYNDGTCLLFTYSLIELIEYTNRHELYNRRKLIRRNMYQEKKKKKKNTRIYMIENDMGHRMEY